MNKERKRTDFEGMIYNSQVCLVNKTQAEFSTGGPFMVRTWLRESCRQFEQDYQTSPNHVRAINGRPVCNPQLGKKP